MRILFLAALLILLTLCSCRELVTDQFPRFNPVPAVNSIMIAGKPIIVNVSLAEKIDSNQITLVNNASISLYTDGNFQETLLQSESGLYVSSSIVEPGRNYRLDVNVPGYNTITCTENIPAPSPILKILHNSKAGKDEEGMIYPSVTVSFKTNPAEKQYFEIVIRMLETRDTRAVSLMKITDPVLLNEGLPLTIFSNEVIRDSVYAMTINYFTGSAGYSGNEPNHTTLYPLIIELRSCSYNYYKFIKQRYLYEMGRFPEFPSATVTAFPLYSNIPGGYGIFAGYSVVVSDTLFPRF